MIDELTNLAGQLKNSEAGWVTRRDAAEKLGEIAATALTALHEHRDEPDQDVRRSVDKALGAASGALEGIAPASQDREYSLRELAEACAKGDERTVEESGDGFLINVMLKSGRHQTVRLDNHNRKDGTELVRVFSKCGPAKEDAFSWALKANMKISHGALAIMTENEEKFLVMTHCYLAKQAAPRAVKASVKEMAHYADWIENKLTGLDGF